MKTVIIISALLFSKALLGQRGMDSIENEFRLITSVKVLDQKAQTFNGKFTGARIQKPFGSTFGFYQNTFRLLRSDFTIRAVAKEDEIHSMLMIESYQDTTKWEMVEDTLINWTDSSFIDIYISEHNKLYGTSFIRKDYGLSLLGRFGISCGLHGRPEPSMILTCKVVTNQSKDKLKQWATSLSAQERIHGTVGLLYLKSKGVSLTLEEDRVIKLNQKSNDLVEFCYGCTDGPFENMKVLMTNKLLKAYFSWFENCSYERN